MKKRKILLIILDVIVILALAAGGAYYFKKYRDLKGQYNDATKQLDAYKADPNQAAQAEINKTIAQVGKLYALPKDENPSVATVKDKTKLKDQPFFANAQNGDITLIYSNAKLAILYRPSTNQIVNVSSVTIQNNNQTQTPTTNP